MKPSSLYKGKLSESPDGNSPRWLQWVPLITLIGGLLASLLVYHLPQRDLALGLGWGSVLTVLNFYSLKILTEKLLHRAGSDGRKFFWFWNGVRWCFLTLGCWAFLSISPTCLAGAGLSYFWFLLVLGGVGWSFSKPKEASKGQTKFF